MAQWLLVGQVPHEALGMVSPLALSANRNLYNSHYDTGVWWHVGFYGYYQIGQDHEDDESTGSKDTGELIATGMNSPWGFYYQVVKDTGWTMDYILWGISQANLMLMMADRPNFKKTKKKEVSRKVSAKEALALMMK